MPYATPTEFVIQYDGTNSAALLASLNASGACVAALVSESAGVLVVSIDNWDHVENATFHTGDWMRPSDQPVIPAAVFAERWIVKP